MEKCICSEDSSYKCKSCKFICAKTLKVHEKLNTEEIFKGKIATLNLKQIGSINSNLINKIQIINACSETIIYRTQILIEKIKRMSLQSIKQLNIKKQHYMNLLKHDDKSVITEKRQNIQRELETDIISFIPTQTFKEIDQFYKSPFIKETKNIIKFRSMKINDLQHVLEEEYRLPISAKFKSGRILESHDAMITTLALISDNKYIISGGKSMIVRIWNIEKNIQEAALQGHTDSIEKVLVTSDNKFIVSISLDRTARIWNFENRTQEAILQLCCIYDSCIKLTSDNKYIFYLNPIRDVIQWNFQTKLHKIINQDYILFGSTLSVSADNKYIITGSSDKSIRVWNLNEKRQEALFTGHSDTVATLAITTDNKYIISACLFENALRIWNLETKQLVDTLTNFMVSTHYSDNYIAIARDNIYLYYESSERTLSVWNLQARRQEKSIQGFYYCIPRILITNDNTRIASGSYDDKLIVDKPSERNQEVIVYCLSHFVGTIAISNDNKFIISSNGKEIKVLDTHDANEKYILHSLNSVITSVVVSNDNRFIVFGSGSASGTYLSNLRDTSIRIWDFQEKKEIAILAGHTKAVTALAISNDNKYIVSGSLDRTLRLWDLPDKQLIDLFRGDAGPVKAVAITSDNKYIVSASDDETLKVWSVKMKIKKFVLKDAGCIERLLITLDNKFIVSCTGKTVS